MNATPVISVVFGLIKVILKMLVPPTPMVEGLKNRVAVGAVIWVKVSAAVWVTVTLSLMSVAV